jgi:hypothetical protein
MSRARLLKPVRQAVRPVPALALPELPELPELLAQVRLD